MSLYMVSFGTEALVLVPSRVNKIARSLEKNLQTICCILCGDLQVVIRCRGSALNSRDQPRNNTRKETRKPVDSSTTRSGDFDYILPSQDVVNIDLEMTTLIDPIYLTEPQVTIPSPR